MDILRALSREVANQFGFAEIRDTAFRRLYSSCAKSQKRQMAVNTGLHEYQRLSIVCWGSTVNCSDPKVRRDESPNLEAQHMLVLARSKARVAIRTFLRTRGSEGIRAIVTFPTPRRASSNLEVCDIVGPGNVDDED